jgi:hypothetical protein
MGVFWRGLPYFLVERSSMLLTGNSEAIETGTYLGDSAEVLAAFFAKVTTIERDKTLAKKATNRFINNEDVSVLLGSSRDLLRGVVPPVGCPTLFWLDAHFSGGVTAGEDDPCPLLEELTTIASLRDSNNTIILIDDARALTGSGGWPTLDEVCAQFKLSNWCIAAIDDVLVCSNRDFVKNLLDRPHGISRLYALEKLAGEWLSLTWVMAPAKVKALARGVINRLIARILSLVRGILHKCKKVFV